MRTRQKRVATRIVITWLGEERAGLYASRALFLSLSFPLVVGGWLRLIVLDAHRTDENSFGSEVFKRYIKVLLLSLNTFFRMFHYRWEQSTRHWLDESKYQTTQCWMITNEQSWSIWKKLAFHVHIIYAWLIVKILCNPDNSQNTHFSFQQSRNYSSAKYFKSWKHRASYSLSYLIYTFCNFEISH